MMTELFVWASQIPAANCGHFFFSAATMDLHLIFILFYFFLGGGVFSLIHGIPQTALAVNRRQHNVTEHVCMYTRR